MNDILVTVMAIVGTITSISVMFNHILTAIEKILNIKEKTKRQQLKKPSTRLRKTNRRQRLK